MNKEKSSEIINLLKKNYPGARYYLNFNNPLELMIAAILSAQCTDEVVNATTKELFRRYKSAKDYVRVKTSELEDDIKKITFFRNKAKNIQKACSMLIEKYYSKVPDTMEDLIALPGIARKTANVILSNAFNKVLGIPTDTHYLRVSYRLGWTKSKNPEIVERDSMNLIPWEHWKQIPYLLKAHGKAICKAPIPYCSKCFLDKLCPKQGVIKKL